MCVCLCVFVCMYARTRFSVFICERACVRGVCEWVGGCVLRVCARVRVCVSVCVWVCVCVSVYVYMCCYSLDCLHCAMCAGDGSSESIPVRNYSCPHLSRPLLSQLFV